MRGIKGCNIQSHKGFPFLVLVDLEGNYGFLCEMGNTEAMGDLNDENND